MQKKQVAVLDIDSSKITAVVGERGINKTFLVRGENSFQYDGFGNGEFLDTDNLARTLSLACEFIKSVSRNLSSVYVGVPGEFTKIIVKDSQISFSKRKKITEEDLDKLFDAAFMVQSEQYSLINRSAIVYELDDYRRLANPVGIQSELLKAKLSFVLCSNYFLNEIKPILTHAGFNKIEFVSTSIAQAMYLVDAETRDRIAQILDVGYISTTFSVIQGDGIIFQKTFPYGSGYIAGSLCEHFDIDFKDAEELKNRVNLSSLSSTPMDYIDCGNGKFYSITEVKSVVKDSLDVLCEYISKALEECTYAIPEYVSLYITNDGIIGIRGAKEHVSSRLNCAVEIITPSVPMMEKAEKSSVLSLLNIALEQNN